MDQRMEMKYDRLLIHRDALLVALKDQVGPEVDLTKAPCHLGITTASKCCKCGREIIVRALIAEVEADK